MPFLRRDHVLIATVPVALGMLVCGGVIAWVAVFGGPGDAELREFRTAFAEERLLDRTPESVLREFGEPIARENGPGGQIEMLLFRSPKGVAYATLEFEGGLVSAVSVGGK